MPLGTALNYAGYIADALEAPHEKGITHRYLKPANIMITPDGVVNVLDFGLAQIAQPSAASGNPISSPTLIRRATEAGMIVGTAAYMAPEQARGQPVDKRAYIWAWSGFLKNVATSVDRWVMATSKRLTCRLLSVIREIYGIITAVCRAYMYPTYASETIPKTANADPDPSRDQSRN